MMLAYDDIGLLSDMMSFQVDFTIGLWEKAIKDVDVDFIYLGEDMAYKNGPMFSPDLCRSLIVPQYKRLTDFLRQHRVKNIILDSDGCIWKLLDMFVECGITGILPLERVAGMDPIKIRKEFPRLQMIGGIDKLKIAEGDAGIKREIKIVKELVGQGGWIPSFDHSVPPIVSFENYFLYINMLKNTLI
jgi:hypothetical protein